MPRAKCQYLALDRLSPRGLDNVIAVVWPAVAYALSLLGRSHCLVTRKSMVPVEVGLLLGIFGRLFATRVLARLL